MQFDFRSHSLEPDCWADAVSVSLSQRKSGLIFAIHSSSQREKRRGGHRKMCSPSLAQLQSTSSGIQFILSLVQHLIVKIN
jgi:hypothetical protein